MTRLWANGVLHRQPRDAREARHPSATLVTMDTITVEQ